ncbi:iron-containing alcohol dehydrogenase [Desulfogranum mediterraneum]|uniref:iron-containing alcohol dehydrogenase n=1 Tax=Desulfogranum mediterraneum TaxID=160661 RepID=UPI0003FA1931|nr:iron-containing alcohol dehydrogenase [Desulfogranum mediterraneum]
MSHNPPLPPFTFATATRIVFGCGSLATLGQTAASLTPRGSTVLLVCGSSPERIQPALELLHQQELATTCFQIREEPSVAAVAAGLDHARSQGCKLVVGIGGGSVVDAAKAMAVLLTNPGDPLDYLEIVGRGKPLSQPPLPYIAIPTTAGTGAEVTANAVLTAQEHGVKVSLRSPMMLPRVAIIDPELSLSLPPQATAYTGLDALTQVLEPYVSSQPNPLTDLFCRDGLIRATRALPRVCEQASDLQAREEMALVSLYGGLALANAKLGAVHGIAGPFGGMFPAPHGGVCAALLAPVMEVNIQALRGRAPHHPALGRYHEVSRILCSDPQADALDGTAWLRELVRRYGLPGLGGYGFRLGQADALAEKASRASSMQGNPIRLKRAELQQIFQLAL